MKRTFISFAVAGVLTLTACGGSIPEDPENKTAHFYDLAVRDCDTGATYTISGYLVSQSLYLDYATMETAPLCAVPNCNHTISGCLANMAQYPVIYQNYMYFFTYSQGFEETKDGPRFAMHSSLKKASLNDSEVQVVCEFNDSIPRNDESMVIYDNKLYFAAYDPDVETDEYGGSNWSNVGGIDYLCSVDLDTKEYRNYGSFCYVEDEYPSAGQSSHSYITGIREGKIFLDYIFSKERFSRDTNTPEWTYYNFEFDTKTEQFTESELPAAICADDELYCWLDDKNDELHIIMNDKENVVSYDSYTNSAHHLGEKLFVANGWVDLSDMSMHMFTEPEYTGIAYYDECYIIKTGTNSFEKLTEEELRAL